MLASPFNDFNGDKTRAITVVPVRGLWCAGRARAVGDDLFPNLLPVDGNVGIGLEPQSHLGADDLKHRDLDVSTTTGEEIVLFTLAESPLYRETKKR